MRRLKRSKARESWLACEAFARKRPPGEDQGRNEKRPTSNPDHAGDRTDDQTQRGSAGDGKRRQAFAFRGWFQGMRARSEAIMQLSLTQA
jgi:hypothetical protein